MARIKRMSVALVLALIMVMAFAGTALAFDPPDNEDASSLSGVAGFPASGVLVDEDGNPANPPGVDPGSGAFGPWNAVVPTANPGVASPIDL